MIRKTTDDGFAHTELATVLAALDVHTIVICGVMSEMCVSATARTALSKGLSVIVPHDAHATYDIPEAPGISPAVPASFVSRVAEWSLGDEVCVVANSRTIAFTAAAITRGCGPL